MTPAGASVLENGNVDLYWDDGSDGWIYEVEPDGTLARWSTDRQLLPRLDFGGDGPLVDRPFPSGGLAP